MFWTQPISGRGKYEKEVERIQSSHYGSSGLRTDDAILEIYRGPYRHPNRLRSLGFEFREKDHYFRINCIRFHRRVPVRMRSRRKYYLKLRPTHLLTRHALRPRKSVKRITKPVGHIPIPSILNLKLTRKRRTHGWHPRKKYRFRRSYGSAGMNPCRAWSKRPKRR